jgi:radical SAM protein with 4Fe4S-binding SPASM domain
MTGCERGNEIIHSAMANLRRAGYPSAGRRMAISTVICGDNIDELPELWRWIRSQGMLPYFEMVTPQGMATHDAKRYCLESRRVQSLFEELSRIDRTEFGRSWEPQPPLVGNTCKRHQFSCVVSATGAVHPCVGVTVALGNIRTQPLADILRSSEVLENLRDYRNKIKEPCRTCEKAEDCYGCRGAAYQLTGDYLAADPLCWRAEGARIDTLPTDAAPLVMHGPSIRMVDRLLRVGEREAEAELTVRKDCAFVDENGLLDETAYVEIIAQSFAACHGFHLPAESLRSLRGFLAGVRGLRVHRRAAVGERLTTLVKKVARLGNYGAAEGTVRNSAGAIVAEGTIKVWQASSEPAAAEAAS